MKNWNRILFVFIAFTVAQLFGNAVYAQQCIPADLGTVNVSAAGADDLTIPVVSGPQCYWALSSANIYPWIIFEDYYWSRLGPESVTVDVLPNAFGDPPREGYILIDDVYTGRGTITVKQAAYCYVKRFQGPDAVESVFVARPDCDAIAEINSVGTGTTVPDVGPDPQFEGVEYGPDDLLYVSDAYAADIGGGVYAVVPGTGVLAWGYHAATGFDPRNARFNSKGDLIVADGAGGLKIFENEIPISGGINLGDGFSLVSDSALFGGFVDVTTAVNGDLLGLTATSVVRFPYDPNTGGYEPGIILPPSLSGANAIARTSTNKIVVADGSDLTVFRADGTSPSPCASFAVTETVSGLEPAANDTLYATLVDGNDGQLIKIPFISSDSSCGTPVPLATFTGAGGSSQPVHGVAVSFGEQIGVRVDNVSSLDFPDGTFPDGTWAFSFNEQVYEITPEITDETYFNEYCGIEATAFEVNPADLQFLLGTISASGVPVVFEGENGRALKFDYSLTGPAACETYVASLSHAINAYYHASSPTPVVCHDPGSGQECYETTFLSTSGFGYLPDDPRTKGGGGADFSFTFLEDKSGPDPNYSGNFCGFGSSLEGTTELDPLIVNGGSTVPIGFTVSETKNCKKGPFIDGITAVLSVAQTDPVFDPVNAEEIVIVGGGSSEDGRIVFNVPVSSKKGYELQFKAEYADGTPFEAGATFELVVTDDSGMYFPFQSAFIKIAD